MNALVLWTVVAMGSVAVAVLGGYAVERSIREVKAAWSAWRVARVAREADANHAANNVGSN